jgi:chromosome segregation ATPase
MITTPAQNQNHQNLTPNDLTPEQDMLLLAGSKVSFKELYHKEIDLPIFKNKYYKAEDVDNLYVLINGMFTQVSEQAYRNDKALAEARIALNKAQNELHLSNEQLKQMTQQVATLKTSNADMQKQLADEVNKQMALVKTHENDHTIQDLSKQLEDKSNDYQRLLTSSSAKMMDQEAQIQNMTQKQQDKDMVIDNLRAQLANEQKATQEAKQAYTGLQSQLGMLSYKYANLKKLNMKMLSIQRIQTLQHENL